MTRSLPISDATWDELIECNRRVVNAGMSSVGVFAPGIGPAYQPGGRRSLLYVGKSAGPLNAAVGSNLDQLSSIQASTEWMIERRNKSAFWQFLELFDKSRRTVAWTNLCKMDERDGSRPPTSLFWNMFEGAHRKAFQEEVRSFQPRVILFATSGFARHSVQRLLQDLQYKPVTSLSDGQTHLRAGQYGQAIETRHPQGWSTSDRAGAVALVRARLEQD